MAIDRLAELRRNAGGSAWHELDESEDSPPPTTRGKSSSKESQYTNGDSSGLDMNQLMRRYDGIKGGLEIITASTAQINTLRQKYKESTKEKQKNEIIRQMEDCMQKATDSATKIKRTLDEIRQDNSSWQQNNPSMLYSAAYQARDNLFQTHIRRFSSLMTEYHSAASSFKQSVLDRTKRDIKNVDSSLTDATIDKIVDSGQGEMFVSESLLRDNSQLEDTVRLIEQRHTDIMELERSVREVFELFKDLSMLVDMQQESLDVIENRIDRAREHVEVGAINIQEASDYQNKARRRRCCLLFLLLGLLGVILGPIIATSVKKS